MRIVRQIILSSVFSTAADTKCVASSLVSALSQSFTLWGANNKFAMIAICNLLPNQITLPVGLPGGHLDICRKVVFTVLFEHILLNPIKAGSISPLSLQTLILCWFLLPIQLVIDKNRLRSRTSKISHGKTFGRQWVESSYSTNALNWATLHVPTQPTRLSFHFDPRTALFLPSLSIWLPLLD